MSADPKYVRQRPNHLKRDYGQEEEQQFNRMPSPENNSTEKGNQTTETF